MQNQGPVPLSILLCPAADYGILNGYRGLHVYESDIKIHPFPPGVKLAEEVTLG